MVAWLVGIRVRVRAGILLTVCGYGRGGSQLHCHMYPAVVMARTSGSDGGWETKHI